MFTNIHRIHREHVSTLQFNCEYQVSLLPPPISIYVTSPILSPPAPSRPHLRSTPACITDQHPRTAPQSLLAPAEPGSSSHPSRRSKTSLATISLPSLGFACFNVVADPPSHSSHHHLYHVPQAKPLIGLPRRQGGIDIDNNAQPVSKASFLAPWRWGPVLPCGTRYARWGDQLHIHYTTVLSDNSSHFPLLDVSKTLLLGITFDVAPVSTVKI